jgi:uncharacterized protein involved in response to NO
MPPAPAGPRPIPVRPVAAPVLADASPLSLATGAPDPYRLMFPLGAAFAVAGTLPWVAHALGLAAYPGPLHRALMVQGFELAFVLGFLLTAMPAFTRGERCRPWELSASFALLAASGAAALAARYAVAHALFAATLLLLAVITGRRVARARTRPPEEYAFVGLGLLLGLVGGVLQAGSAAGAWGEPAPLLGSRLVSLGMMLSIVLGVGALLVPAFIGMREPMKIPGVAGAHERAGRRRLYGALLVALAGSFALDATRHGTAGAWVRALAALAQLLWVWKLWRAPGRRDRFGWALWCSGWLTGLGVLLAALVPAHATALLHVTFLGGYGLLTLGIGSRVTVAHGRHPMTDEPRVYSAWVVSGVALALALRVAAEWSGAGGPHALAASATAWLVAWGAWLARAIPRIARTRSPRG